MVIMKNLEHYENLWKDDAKIDETMLDKEALKIPTIHGRWLGYLEIEKNKLYRMRRAKYKMENLRREWYNGLLSEDERKKIGWEPCRKRIAKGEIDNYMKADNTLQKISEEVEGQECVVHYLEETLKQVQQRTWLIKNSIEFSKLITGAI